MAGLDKVETIVGRATGVAATGGGSGAESCAGATGGGGGGGVIPVSGAGAGGVAGKGGAGRVRTPLSVGSEPRSTGGGGEDLRLTKSGLSEAKQAKVSTAAVEMVRVHII